MEKRNLAFLSVAALIIGIAASYPMNQLFVVPSTAVVPSATVNIWIDNEAWSNGTELSWGTVYPSEIVSANLTVQNTGKYNATVTVTCPDLPDGWSLTWTENGKNLLIDEVLEGDLDLTVPVDAEPGSYEWNLYILAEQT